MKKAGFRQAVPLRSDWRELWRSWRAVVRLLGENLAGHQDSVVVTADDIAGLAAWSPRAGDLVWGGGRTA